MGDTSDSNAVALALGEMRGKMGEMVHTQNNMLQKIDFLTEKALTAPTTPQIDALAKRIDALEATNDRNDGAKGVFAAILQSRFAAWVAASLGAAYIAIDKGLFK